MFEKRLFVKEKNRCMGDERRKTGTGTGRTVKGVTESNDASRLLEGMLG